jgi:putative acetyltransferase
MDNSGQPMDIRITDPHLPQVTQLLRLHLDDMAVHSPPESIHALDIDALCAPHITFWAAWRDGALLGCGALSELDATHGEIKSMRTHAAYLRQGVAGRLLNTIMATAKQRNYVRISLETGSMEAFAPARRLYEINGFELCKPFGHYELDRNSLFMTRQL